MSDPATQNPPDVEPFPPRYWWARRIGIGCAVLLLLLGAARWCWGVYAERKVAATIAEYRARGEPVLFEDFAVPDVPDKENAAYFLQKAAATITVPAGSPIDLSDVAGDIELIAEYKYDVKRLVEANTNVLRLVRRARRAPHTDWKIRFKSLVAMVRLPSLSRQRDVGRFLAMAAGYQHLTGDDAAAIETLLGTLELGRRLDAQGAVLVTHLVAIAIDGLATVTIEGIAPRLRIRLDENANDDDGHASSHAVRELIAALLDEQALVAGWRNALAGQRLFAYDWIVLAGQNPLSALSFGGSAGGPSPPTVWGLVLGPMFQLDAVFALEQLTRISEAGAAKAYSREPVLPLGLSEVDNGPAYFVHLFSRMLMPTSNRQIVIQFRGIARRRMAATALAIRMFELRYGQRPETLDELVPEFLSAVPQDPFSQNGDPLRYAPAADPALLYSIGEDGVDHGGSVSDDRDKRDLVFFLNGDRPRDRPSYLKPPTTMPDSASTQAIEDENDVIDDTRDADQAQAADDQP